MGLRDTLVTAFAALFLTLILFLTLGLGGAAVMESSNYKIESDSINFGGGLSTSTSYTLESTAGELATGESGSANFNLKAGYQQMLTTYLSMSTPSSVTMAPPIPGVTGGTADGATTVTVTTDSAAGYQLTIQASESPALTKGSDSIADYVPVGDPDFFFAIDPTDSHLGYSPSGVDVAQRFLDDGASLCNTGSTETDLACWDGLSTTPATIALRTSANTPNGSTTTVNFRVGIGGSVVQTAGTYTATTTLTALPL